MLPWVPLQARKRTRTWVAAPAPTVTPAEEDALEAILRKYDTDGDSLLTIAQARKALQELRSAAASSSASANPATNGQASSSSNGNGSGETPSSSAAAPAVAARPAGPYTWDLHLRDSVRAAALHPRGVPAAAAAFAASKLQGVQKARPLLSDMLWSAVGVALAFAILGYLAPLAKTFPVVGEWHRQARAFA